MAMVFIGDCGMRIEATISLLGSPPNESGAFTELVALEPPSKADMSGFGLSFLDLFVAVDARDV